MSREYRPRVAVISPFVDRSHGTELMVAEWIEHLAEKFELHLYSQSVRDVDPRKFVWHRIPALPVPHLFNYMWWFLANQMLRAFDRNFRGEKYDLVFSPGINCFDADVVSVHVVFAEYVEKNAGSLRLSRHSLKQWPLLIHRKLYYWLIQFLERSVYRRSRTVLVPTARKTAQQLARFFGRGSECPVVYAGLDPERFNPQVRAAARARARREMGLADDSFALLLIGNDWRNKGVPVLFEALAILKAPIELLVVSREDPEPVHAIARQRGLDERIHTLPPRDDVEFFYAAADAYVGPSLEDSYGIPPAEAMACGLPVIVSAAAGVSEIVCDGVDGLILWDPTDAGALAAMIRRIHKDAEFRTRLGERASQTARQCTWERAGEEMNAIFQQVLRRKAGFVAEKLARDF